VRHRGPLGEGDAGRVEVLVEEAGDLLPRPLLEAEEIEVGDRQPARVAAPERERGRDDGLGHAERPAGAPDERGLPAPRSPLTRTTSPARSAVASSAPAASVSAAEVVRRRVKRTGLAG